MEQRTLNITFGKSGNGGINPRLSTPKSFLYKMGVTPENKEVNLTYDDLSKKIIIEKYWGVSANEDMLIDIIEYGNYILSLDELDKKAVLKSLIYEHLNSLNAIFILTKFGCESEVDKLARCYLEFTIQLIFICKEKELIDKKTLAYEYFAQKNKLDICKIDELIKNTDIHLENYGIEKQDDEAREEFINNLKVIEKESNDVKKVLESARYNEIVEEIRRIEKIRGKKRQVKNFYECFIEDGSINSFSTLCEFCGYKHEYITSYRLFSQKIHGSNISKTYDNNVLVLKKIFELTFDLFKILCDTLLTPKDFENLSFMYFKIKIKYKFIPFKIREKAEKTMSEIMQFYNIKNEQILKKKYSR